jgi:hypothetical protein
MLSPMVEVRHKFEKIEIRTKMDERGDFSIQINFSSSFVMNASPKILRQIDFSVVVNSCVKSLDQTQS